MIRNVLFYILVVILYSGMVIDCVQKNTFIPIENKRFHVYFDKSFRETKISPLPSGHPR